MAPSVHLRFGRVADAMSGIQTGHVRSQQRRTPTTPRAAKGRHFIPTPRGISGLALATPTHLSCGVSASIVEDHFPIQPGYPCQPTSSRWPVSDDRFHNSPRSPRITQATPSPNHVSLEDDVKAWRGGQLSTMRGGKAFTLRPGERGGIFATVSADHYSKPLHECTTAFARAAKQSSDYEALAHRPWSEQGSASSWQGRPRAVFPASTTLELDMFRRTPRATPASIARLHEGRRD